jgi:glycosyltransferase involved in cell wall biosynthesis
MRFLILDTYYEQFLESVYKTDKDLKLRPYAEQWRSIMDRCFGTADFYSSNLKELGFEAAEIIPNCVPLQEQWAKENGIDPTGAKGSFHLRKGFIPSRLSRPTKEWFYRILKAQVAAFKPDILYIQDMNWTDPVFLREVRPQVRWIIGQIACPIPPGMDYRGYDLVLTALPYYVDYFRDRGLTSEHMKLAFGKEVLTKLRASAPQYRAVFVGGLSSVHQQRIGLLERLAAAKLLDFWGYGVEALSPDSPLRSCYRGKAWALDMYRILQESKITVNCHTDIAREYAVNIRLYEATGVGTMLLTDYKDNLGELFEVGREVVAYDSPRECMELIGYYLDHEEEREAIAMAGQERTLREHTFMQRMRELLDIVERVLVRAAAK